MLKRSRKVDIREKGLHLRLGHPAVHEGLDLRQQGSVFRYGSLVHGRSKLGQLRQERLLLRVRLCGTVLPQDLQQISDLSFGLLDVLLFPHLRRNLGKQLRVLQCIRPSARVIPFIQFIERRLLLCLVLHELDDRVFLIVFLVQPPVQGGESFCGRNHCAFIDLRADLLSPRLGSCHLGLDLLPDGVKAILVIFLHDQLIADQDRVPGINQLLQTIELLFCQECALLLLLQLCDFLIQ